MEVDNIYGEGEAEKQLVQNKLRKSFRLEVKHLQGIQASPVQVWPEAPHTSRIKLVPLSMGIEIPSGNHH